MNVATAAPTATTLKELIDSGWESKTVKREIRDNFTRMLASGEELFPGIVGYDDTVIPEINLALLAGHDMLFLGEKGQAKSRIMRMLTRFLDEWIPFIDHPELPVHEDPTHPVTSLGRKLVETLDPEDIKIGWWHRDHRYSERLSPGTKFADIIGEIDPAKLTGGVSMSAEEALSFGLIPRMHRGIFAMNELPELDDLVQVGLFNILEERDVQIRGFPIRFDLDIMILFSANPSTYNRSGKVIPQLKDRIGTIVQTHYPTERDQGIDILRQEIGDDLEGEYPVQVPYFMFQLVEEITEQARRSKFIDQASGVSARFSLANFRIMVASARQRGILHNERPAVPRISDLGHLYSSSLGKLELDLMGTHQMSEKQVLDAVVAKAVQVIFGEYVEKHGLGEIAEIFRSGVRVEVGDLLPSSHYAERLQSVPPAWNLAFQVNASESEAVRASCVEFVLAGLYSMDRISRAQRHGKIEYEV
ncbi:MAG: magnesium chelatase [Phycisphaera sp. RhM]|nr:magnesium chelatase [Phycisphaera sp. RhM]